MERIRELFRKFQNSDGRIKALTATSILALAAVVALAVGVLPALGTHGSETVAYGGGDGGCAFVGSDAAYELHVNNPQDGFYTDPATGAEIEVDVSDDDKFLEWRFTDARWTASDIVINGGSQSTWTVYEPAVTEDWNEGDAVGDLHAPANRNGFFNLSHINLCYDIAPVDVLCGVPTEAIVLNDGLITGATVQVLEFDGLSQGDICKPDASFYIDNTGDFTGANAPVVFLDFGAGTEEVPIRFDVTKDLGSPPAGGYPDLLYSETLTSPRTVMSWCNMEAADGRTDFDDVVDPSQYPTNAGVSDDLFTGVEGDDAILCKVFEGEGSDGQQKTTGFGKLTDPGMW